MFYTKINFVFFLHTLNIVLLRSLLPKSYHSDAGTLDLHFSQVEPRAQCLPQSYVVALICVLRNRDSQWWFSPGTHVLLLLLAWTRHQAQYSLASLKLCCFLPKNKVSKYLDQAVIYCKHRFVGVAYLDKLWSMKSNFCQCSKNNNFYYICVFWGRCLTR